MKRNGLKCYLLFLVVGTVFQLHAQQGEVGHRLLALVRMHAEKGDAQSQFDLGAAFYSGSLGLPKDAVEAVKWFRKGAEQNYAQAQSSLGLCYKNGEGVVKDYVEAIKWFRKGAVQNCRDAQYNLGLCYTFAQGVAKMRWRR